ncbi:MAG: hypothetical protein Q4B52_06400 [Tissierellia bacterium]|nr:hypothetical protein [Tissierellia bacterium]
MRKVLLYAFLLITLCSCSQKKDQEMEKKVDVTMEKSSNLKFTQSKDSITKDQLSDINEYFVVKDKEGNNIDVKKRWYDTNIIEVYAKDKDGVEIRKLVNVVSDSNIKNNNSKVIEKPDPHPDKKYR